MKVVHFSPEPVNEQLEHQEGIATSSKGRLVSSGASRTTVSSNRRFEMRCMD